MESKQKLNQSRRRFARQAAALGLGACVIGHVQAGAVSYTHLLKSISTSGKGVLITALTLVTSVVL